MIGYDDPWFACCGKAFGAAGLMFEHQRECPECLRIQCCDFRKELREENDADDRGICYEDD